MDKLPDETITRERLHLGTDDFTVLATCEQTGDALFAVEVSMQPGGGPPLMHRHDPGEVYHVLRGEFTFYIGEIGDDGRVRRVTAGAGDVVPLAGRTPHTVRNESDAEAVAFVVHAPGPPMEGFTRAAGARIEPRVADAVLPPRAATRRRSGGGRAVGHNQASIRATTRECPCPCPTGL